MNFRSSTSNKPLTLSNIYKLLQTPFYYGKFEYPVKSGNWYMGKHEPLINIELFEKVREQLKRSEITHERKDYAFSRLMTCGLCGSGICAEDKYKKLKNGGTAHYIYYGCNRSKNLDCKCGYIREEELIKQLVEMIDKIEVDQKFIKGKFEQERERMVTFQKQFYGVKQSKLEIEFDSKKYTEHVLTEGTVEEKREMLANLKGKVIMKNKEIIITQ
ncbi:MAG: recombinase zinc beta ribbon domain-containing protein [bacterium]